MTVSSCASSGLDGVRLKLMDNSFRLPDKYEERYPGVIPVPEGLRLIGAVELGRVHMSVEDVLWYVRYTFFLLASFNQGIG